VMSAAAAPAQVPRGEPAPAVGDNATASPPQAAGADSLDALPPEVRRRLLEAAVIDELLHELYFVGVIRARLDDSASLGEQVRRAARAIGLKDTELPAAIVTLDSGDGRASLATLVPEHDDADQLRVIVRDDLIRIAAPLPNEPAIDDAARQRAIDAGKQLLRAAMNMPGGTVVWGKVDVEVDGKIRSIVASRAPRTQYRPWCELAAWVLIAQGLNERALGVTEKSSKWIADAGQTASTDFAAVQVLALKGLGRAGESKLAAKQFPLTEAASADLRARIDHATR